jgi:hypothetical protein
LPGQDVYLKNKDEVLIAFEGVFYRLVRREMSVSRRMAVAWDQSYL